MTKKKTTKTPTIKSSAGDKNIAIQNLLEGKATPAEIEELKKALASGEISIGGDVNRSVVIIGAGNTVQLSPEAISRLNAKEDFYLPIPNQLPPLPADFVGRQEELTAILDSIQTNNDSNINIITGMAGVGKSTLAIMVAARAKDNFTDGVLYIDFRGRSEDPLKPTDAMRHVLRSLGQEVSTYPDTEIAGIYRFVLSRKKVLMVFSNVDSETQIEPLLPPKPCKIIVTSRKRLTIQNSITWALGVLPERAAIQLLGHAYSRGNENAVLDDEDAKALVVALGNHPLAIRLAAGAIANYGYSPKEYLAQLSLEILKNAKDDPTSVFTYLSRISSPDIEYLRKIVQPTLNEAKILFVGQGSVGKTSIIKQILSGVFDKHEGKTDGISINHFQIANCLEKNILNSEIRLNIWDFGGQEIMHATHQFFLTKRSLYLLVLDSRLTQEENRVEYWLKIIQSFSDESPVLIVGNKIDQHPLDIDRTGLQKKYPNIVGILETSAATGAGIEALKIAIAEQVSKLPHVSTRLPQTWFAVKTALEELGRESNFITHDKYLELCAENEVTDETSQRTLIGFLHDLGVVLHFQDDPRLEALGILNPQWVTNGVYKILNSHTLFQNKGVLTISMLDEILNLPEYPRGKRLFIVDMMKKFELCYDIVFDKTFLVPDLLPKDEPAELRFNGVPAFEYAYPVLPSSVMTRFIVRMNQKIDDGFVWRTGVVLKIGENTALVKADIEDRKITIAIDGLEHTRRDALSAIRYQLDEIHASIKGLDAQKRVPIPEASNAEPLDYDYLLQLERDGFEELPVKDGNRLVKVNVRKLLSGVVSETERRQSAGNTTNIYIGGDVKGGTIIAGDENKVKR